MKFGGFHFRAYLAWIVAFAAVFALTTSLGAHDGGYRWEFPEVTPKVENRTADYTAAVSSARQDYDQNTDLTVTQCPDNGNCGNLIHLQANWGDTGWIGYADPYSHGVACFDANGNWTGYCNTTSQRVDFSYVYWNNFYGPSPQPNWQARHEMGHAFGLTHVDNCSPSSVMMITSCSNKPDGLTAHDTSDLNGFY